MTTPDSSSPDNAAPAAPVAKPAGRTAARIGPAVAIFCALIAIVVSRGNGRAKVPPAFDAAVTLAQASQTAKAANRPVLVFATADWCGPCQTLKRGALKDERVTSWIKANTTPVYLDVDKSKTEAIELGILSIPVLIVMKDDKIVDRLEGVHSADELVAWLERVK